MLKMQAVKIFLSLKKASKTSANLIVYDDILTDIKVNYNKYTAVLKNITQQLQGKFDKKLCVFLRKILIKNAYIISLSSIKTAIKRHKLELNFKQINSIIPLLKYICLKRLSSILNKIFAFKNLSDLYSYQNDEKPNYTNSNIQNSLLYLARIKKLFDNLKLSIFNNNQNFCNLEPIFSPFNVFKQIENGAFRKLPLKKRKVYYKINAKLAVNAGVSETYYAACIIEQAIMENRNFISVLAEEGISLVPFYFKKRYNTMSDNQRIEYLSTLKKLQIKQIKNVKLNIIKDNQVKMCERLDANYGFYGNRALNATIDNLGKIRLSLNGNNISNCINIVGFSAEYGIFPLLSPPYYNINSFEANFNKDNAIFIKVFNEGKIQAKISVNAILNTLNFSYSIFRSIDKIFIILNDNKKLSLLPLAKTQGNLTKADNNDINQLNLYEINGKKIYKLDGFGDSLDFSIWIKDALEKQMQENKMVYLTNFYRNYNILENKYSHTNQTLKCASNVLDYLNENRVALKSKTITAILKSEKEIIDILVVILAVKFLNECGYNLMVSVVSSSKLFLKCLKKKMDITDFKHCIFSQTDNLQEYKKYDILVFKANSNNLLFTSRLQLQKTTTKENVFTVFKDGRLKLNNYTDNDFIFNLSKPLKYSINSQSDGALFVDNAKLQQFMYAFNGQEFVNIFHPFNKKMILSDNSCTVKKQFNGGEICVKTSIIKNYNIKKEIKFINTSNTKLYYVIDLQDIYDKKMYIQNSGNSIELYGENCQRLIKINVNRAKIFADISTFFGDLNNSIYPCYFDKNNNTLTNEKCLIIEFSPLSKSISFEIQLPKIKDAIINKLPEMQVNCSSQNREFSAFFNVWIKHFAFNSNCLNIIERVYNCACFLIFDERFLQNSTKKIKNANDILLIIKTLVMYQKHGIVPKHIIGSVVEELVKMQKTASLIEKVRLTVSISLILPILDSYPLIKGLSIILERLKKEFAPYYKNNYFKFSKNSKLNLLLNLQLSNVNVFENIDIDKLCYRIIKGSNKINADIILEILQQKIIVGDYKWANNILSQFNFISKFSTDHMLNLNKTMDIFDKTIGISYSNCSLSTLYRIILEKFIAILPSGERIIFNQTRLSLNTNIILKRGSQKANIKFIKSGQYGLKINGLTFNNANTVLLNNDNKIYDITVDN